MHSKNLLANKVDSEDDDLKTTNKKVDKKARDIRPSKEDGVNNFDVRPTSVLGLTKPKSR